MTVEGSSKILMILSERSIYYSIYSIYLQNLFGIYTQNGRKARKFDFKSSLSRYSVKCYTMVIMTTMQSGSERQHQWLRMLSEGWY